MNTVERRLTELDSPWFLLFTILCIQSTNDETIEGPRLNYEVSFNDNLSKIRKNYYEVKYT